jgi:hypothetical protein
MRKLCSVNLGMIIKVGGYPHIASVYSIATDSLRPPSEKAICPDDLLRYNELMYAPSRGVDSAKKEALTNPDEMICEQLVGQDHIETSYTEPHGRVTGNVFDEMHYFQFVIEDVFPEDLKDSVILIPINELREAVTKTNDAKKNLHMEINERSYRINRGITSILEKLEML